jgi:aminoglycoside phosphotransferase (APT) family kinase protein
MTKELRKDVKEKEEVVNSSSKYHQTTNTLKNMTEKALKRQIQLFHSKELGGGMCNAVYKIEADKEILVLKIAPPPSVLLMRHEVNSLINEANMLSLLEEKIQIPAPKMIYLDTTKEICDTPYFFMSYIEGTPLMSMETKLSKIELATIKHQVGIISKEICSIKASCFGIPQLQETYQDNNFDFIYLLFEMLLQDAKDKQILLPGIKDYELLALIQSQKNVLNEADKPCFIHTDTWGGNLLIKDNKLTGLIDYAAVLYGDPLMSHDFHDFDDLNENFLKGFGKTQFSKTELIRISIYKIWQRLGMIVERGYRDYEDKSQYAWVLGEFAKEVENVRSLIEHK